LPSRTGSCPPPTPLWHLPAERAISPYGAAGAGWLREVSPDGDLPPNILTLEGLALLGDPCTPNKVCYTYVVRFTWDRKKAALNLRKHRISFTEAATVFADPLAAMLQDAMDAERSILVGHRRKDAF